MIVHILRWFPIVLFLSLWTVVQANTNTPFLPQSFFFNYNDPSQPVPVPVTAQCDSIHIQWERGTASGPNPTAPYYLQIYTSAYIFPFVVSAGSALSFDWKVPFAPGTQYQICMFDKNGNTGGCQATYTVIPPLTPPTCANATFPLGPLDVEAVVENGPMSQFGWIDQCTDISVTPKNGTPPYTFTIAPALHPPFNITNDQMTSMNWTISLSWASPFFISVADSAGNFWANGPLHSGGGGPTACLAGASSTQLGPSVIVGTGVGGAVFGLLVGMVGAYLFMRHRRRSEQQTQFLDLGSGGSPHSATFPRVRSASSSYYRSVPSTPVPGHVIDASMGSSNMGSSNMGSSNPSANSNMMNRMVRGTQYHIEPFTMPGEDGRMEMATLPSEASNLHPSRRQSVTGPSQQPHQNQVYVVHHDGGRAPVTVYHQDGTEVVELPPRYGGTSQPAPPVLTSMASSEGRSEGYSEGRSDTARTDTTEPAFLHRPRRPGQTHKPTSAGGHTTLEHTT